MSRRASSSASWELRLRYVDAARPGRGPDCSFVLSRYHPEHVATSTSVPHPVVPSAKFTVVGGVPAGSGRWPGFRRVDASWCGAAAPVEMGLMISESLVRRLVIDLCRRPGSCCR
ncbi:hypothetical protein GCM10010228_69600 [Streptomyces massasporeus]|nr:hypothetical protein GCM10010228_69600 [Streptomyces massasporeus]